MTEFRPHHLLLCLALLLAATGPSMAGVGPALVTDCAGVPLSDAGATGPEAPLPDGCGDCPRPCIVHCPGVASIPAGLVSHDRAAVPRAVEPPVRAPVAPPSRLLRPPIPA